MNPFTRSPWVLIPAAYLLITCAAPGHEVGAAGPDAKQSKMVTQWRIEPSFKYDALCLLNTLTGDPFYLWHYTKAYAEFSPKLTPEAKKAVAHLKKVVKDDGGGIISARLCLLFSATDDETLDHLLATVEHPEKLRDNYSKTPYWSDEGWQSFESIRDDLKVIFTWYKQIDFEKFWREKVRPVAEAKGKKMFAKVSEYDVVPLIEQHLGKPLESHTITVYMLTYSQPHGIKITGTRFLTDVAWPFEIVVRNAVHEMMHPPYKLDGDSELTSVMETLRADKFLMNKVEHHNPSFGYNSLEGFVDEDCVQALDQLINERIGVAEQAKSRWKKSDDGMHVLAVALYQMMKAEKYPSSKDKTFRDFMVRMNQEGKFKAGSIKRYHMAMYGK
jgi:hypothetical protein